jgi:hypothetical protein
MKTILLAAITTLALASAAPAFADAAHRDSAGAVARGDWRTNATNGAAAKQYLAAVDPQDLSRVTPRVGLSDNIALS